MNIFVKLEVQYLYVMIIKIKFGIENKLLKQDFQYCKEDVFESIQVKQFLKKDHFIRRNLKIEHFSSISRLKIKFRIENFLFRYSKF